MRRSFLSKAACPLVRSFVRARAPLSRRRSRSRLSVHQRQRLIGSSWRAPRPSRRFVVIIINSRRRAVQQTLLARGSYSVNWAAAVFVRVIAFDHPNRLRTDESPRTSTLDSLHANRRSRLVFRLEAATCFSSAGAVQPKKK